MGCLSQSQGLVGVLCENKERREAEVKLEEENSSLNHIPSLIVYLPFLQEESVVSYRTFYTDYQWKN